MASLSTELPCDPETLQAMLIARDAEIERLRQIIKELQRHRFGRRAESLPEDQLLAGEALQRIAELFHVEAAIRGRRPDERQAARQDKSKPIIAALEPWLRAKLALISQKTKLAEAIRYALSRWEGLTLFLDDGRVELDNNIVERSIRPQALTRKNALFAGSDGGAEHWAVIASLV